MNSTRDIINRFVLAILIAVPVTSAYAGHDDERPASTASNAVWQSECGACHIPYAPRMLPAESWRALMSGLDRHFGIDASLEPSAAREIGSFLETNAGRRKEPASDKPILRISETRWFIREHRKLSNKVWTSDLVKSPANCTACHAQAPDGNYSERNVRVPQ